jgi:hypothetical protein
MIGSTSFPLRFIFISLSLHLRFLFASSSFPFRFLFVLSSLPLRVRNHKIALGRRTEKTRRWSEADVRPEYWKTHKRLIVRKLFEISSHLSDQKTFMYDFFWASCFAEFVSISRMDEIRIRALIGGPESIDSWERIINLTFPQESICEPNPEFFRNALFSKSPVWSKIRKYSAYLRHSASKLSRKGFHYEGYQCTISCHMLHNRLVFIHLTIMKWAPLDFLPIPW